MAKLACDVMTENPACCAPDTTPNQVAKLMRPPATDWRRMTDVAHHRIADRAYQLYEARGRQPGYDMDDWLRAEHDIEERQSAE